MAQRKEPFGLRVDGSADAIENGANVFAHAGVRTAAVHGDFFGSRKKLEVLGDQDRHNGFFGIKYSDNQQLKLEFGVGSLEDSCNLLSDFTLSLSKLYQRGYDFRKRLGKLAKKYDSPLVPTPNSSPKK
jgi:hypothetical protein